MNTNRKNSSLTKRSALTARSSTHGTSQAGLDINGLAKPFRKCEQIIPFIKRIDLAESPHLKKKELELFKKLLITARIENEDIHIKHIGSIDESDNIRMYGSVSKRLYNQICSERRINKYAEWKPLPQESKSSKSGPLQQDYIDRVEVETETAMSAHDNDTISNNGGANTDRGKSHHSARTIITVSAIDHNTGNNNNNNNNNEEEDYTGFESSNPQHLQPKRQSKIIPLDIFGDLTKLLAPPTLKLEDREVPLKKEEVYQPPVGFVRSPTQAPRSLGNEKYYSYDGDWNKGNMEGLGKYVFADGGTYVGDYQHNKFHGKGKSNYPLPPTLATDGSNSNNSSSAGESNVNTNNKVKNTTNDTNNNNNYNNITKNRRSSLSSSSIDSSNINGNTGINSISNESNNNNSINNSSYEGYYRHGRFEGPGTMTCHTGSEYKGEFREGRRDGEGILKLGSGLIYEGSFFDGKPHGHGKITSHLTGYSYEGNFLEGSIQGGGVLITPPPQAKRITQHWPERQKEEADITLPTLIRYYLQQESMKQQQELVRHEQLFAPLHSILLIDYVCKVREDLAEKRAVKKAAEENLKKELKQSLLEGSGGYYGDD